MWATDSSLPMDQAPRSTESLRSCAICPMAWCSVLARASSFLGAACASQQSEVFPGSSRCMLESPHEQVHEAAKHELVHKQQGKSDALLMHCTACKGPGTARSCDWGSMPVRQAQLAEAHPLHGSYVVQAAREVGGDGGVVLQHVVQLHLLQLRAQGVDAAHGAQALAHGRLGAARAELVIPRLAAVLAALDRHLHAVPESAGAMMSTPI